VKREEQAGAEALDLEGPPELAAPGVEDPVRRGDEERQVGDDGGRRGEREDDPQLSRAALPPGDDAEEGDEDGRVQLDGDPEPDDERARAQPASTVASTTSAAGRRSNRVRITPPRSTGSSATAARTSRRSAPPRTSRRSPSARIRTPSAPITAISATNTAR
jgi:hypothetical protein